jgi:hypothetical protein
MWQLLVSCGLAMLLCGGAAAQSPTTVHELQDRWIELLRDADGPISAEGFEKVFGLDLLVTMRGADGAIRRSRRMAHLDGALLDVDIDARPAQDSLSLSLEWTPHFFAVLTGGSCINLAQLTGDLAAMDWKLRAYAGDELRSASAALFRRDGDLVTYGNASAQKNRRCRLSYRSHYFDPAPVGASRRHGS